MTDPSITEIGKYKIIGTLGEGAMGVVYRATDSVIGRTVAVKVMSEAIARQQELRDRFLHEAQAAGSMQHPNIISLYDLGELEGHLYIVMEFVEGVDLAYLISSRKPMTLQTKLDIIIDVLAGLAYAHKRGIVHRDIKPANIRITEEGRAKIMDFGVAHLSTSELTVTGAVVGTPAYMAPEQITGARTTAATDLFATGAVLYELVTGVKAFSAPTIQSLFFKIVAEPPVSVVQVLPGLPPELNRIIEKALQKNQSDRYATALEMANDLTQLRATLSDAPRPATMSLTATVAHAVAEKQREKKRTRELAIGGGALALAVVAAGLFAMSRKDQPQYAAAPVTKIVADSPVAPSARTQKGDVVPAPPAAIVEESPVKQTKAQAKSSPPPAPPRAKKSEAPVVRREVLPNPPIVTRVVPQPQPPPPPPPPTPPPASPPSSVQPSAPPAAPPAPAPTAAGVRAVLQEYEHAIEQRDIGGIRSVYPGLTSSEQSFWENFFREARRIKVAFQVRSLEVNGNSAQSRLTGTYDYEDSAGRPQPTIRVSVNVNLRHDGTAWHIVSIRD